MTVQNLAVIFTPAIFHDHNQGEVPGEWCSDKVFEDLIQHHESIFVAAEKQKRAADANKGKKTTPKQPSERPPEVLPAMDKTLLQAAEDGARPAMQPQASADAVDIDFGPPLGEMLSRSESTPSATEGTPPPPSSEKKGSTQLGRKGSIRFRPRQDSLRRKPSHHTPSVNLNTVEEGAGRAGVGHSRSDSNSSGLNQPSSLVFPTQPPPVPNLPIATTASNASVSSSTPTVQPLPQPQAASLSPVPPPHVTSPSPTAPAPAPVPNPKPDLTPQAPTIASSAPPTTTPIIQTTAASPPATASPAPVPLEHPSHVPMAQPGSTPASAPVNSSSISTPPSASDAKR